jgi:hypothetical protein
VRNDEQKMRGRDEIFSYSSVKESIHFTMNDIDVSRQNTSEKNVRTKNKNETNDNAGPRFVVKTNLIVEANEVCKGMILIVGPMIF